MQIAIVNESSPHLSVAICKIGFLKKAMPENKK